MSTNSNVFDANKKFVDRSGLEYFWGKAKSYIDAADADVAGDLADLAEVVAGLKGTGTGSVADQIAAMASTLRGEMATEQAARIAAEEKVAKDAADALKAEQEDRAADEAALEAALKKYADDAVAAEAALRVEEDGKLSSAISTLRGEYEATKGRIDTFLDSKEVAGTVDTLHEIQEWMNGDGVNATELTEAIAAEAKIRGEEDAKLQGNIDALSGTVASNKSAIEKTVSDMDAAYKLADQTLQGNIDALSGTVASNKSAIEKTVSDMDAAYKLADNGLAADIAELEARIYGDGTDDNKGALADLDATLKAYADQAEADALSAAKKYTDDELVEALGAYTDGETAGTGLRKEIEDRDAAVLSDAHDYTDQLFASVKFVQTSDIDGFNWSAPVAE